ncbi:MAG: Hsp20/alpha crystallin family protein [Planctomycetaceae bacterium]
MSDGELNTGSVPENSNLPVPAQTSEQPERLIYTPCIDIYDSEEGLVLTADLPGVTIDSLELQVQDNKLTLFGRVAPSLPADAHIVHQEYGVGDFLRSFILSDEVDHERITASMSNGVLKVVLPKAPAAKPRRIEVSSD